MLKKTRHYRVHGRYSGKACIIRGRTQRFTHSNEACRFKSVRVRHPAEQWRSPDQAPTHPSTRTI